MYHPEGAPLLRWQRWPVCTLIANVAELTFADSDQHAEWEAFRSASGCVEIKDIAQTPSRSTLHGCMRRRRLLRSSTPNPRKDSVIGLKQQQQQQHKYH